MKNTTFDVISPRDAYASYMMGGILVDVRTPSDYGFYISLHLKILDTWANKYFFLRVEEISN